MTQTTGQEKTRQDKTRQDQTRPDKTRQDQQKQKKTKRSTLSTEKTGEVSERVLETKREFATDVCSSVDSETTLSEISRTFAKTANKRLFRFMSRAILVLVLLIL